MDPSREGYYRGLFLVATAGHHSTYGAGPDGCIYWDPAADLVLQAEG